MKVVNGSARRGSLAAALLLAAALPCAAQPAAETYHTIHEAPPAWLAERFDATVSTVRDTTWSGPGANPEKVRQFLYETYEHVNEVSALAAALGGKTAGISGNGVDVPARSVDGVHDFGERVPVERVVGLIEALKASPPVDRAGRPLPLPEWLTRLPAEAARRGERTIDVGKLSPYVAAGLGREGPPDPFALRLHNLAAHHGAAGSPANLVEAIADRVNAMRQIRSYRPEPIPYEKVEALLLEDVRKGSLPEEARPLIKRAIRAGKHLEATGKMNPYSYVSGERLARRLVRYRRADGTLEWGRLTRDGALKQAGGLAHFGMALFLKELAVVARSGDRARIEEFFDGLTSTDFYKNYGLFALGARAGEVAYFRCLERYVRPGFVNGVLKTNLVLAAGLALPQLVDGTFSGKTFAISLTSLGLSSAAVRGGVAGIRWVSALRSGGGVAGAGRVAGRLARVGGWFYTAAELAVVLYFADAIEEEINEHLDRRAARGALADAGQAFLAAVNDPAATPASMAEAAERYHEAWTGYRDYLYQPLHQDEAVLAARLERIARKAKLTGDERSAALARVSGHDALARSVLARHGSLEAYAEHLTREADAAVARDVETCLASYERARTEHLDEVYTGGRRGAPLLDDIDDLGWLLGGARPGAEGDPYAGRGDVLARLGRARARARLEDALGDGSRNRIEAYDDEVEVLEAAAAALRGDGRGALAAPLERLAGEVTEVRDLDGSLFGGEVREGAAERLGAVTGE